MDDDIFDIDGMSLSDLINMKPVRHPRKQCIGVSKPKEKEPVEKSEKSMIVPTSEQTEEKPKRDGRFPIRAVVLLNPDGTVKERYASLSDAGRANGVDRRNVYHGCHAKRSRWRYADQIDESADPTSRKPESSRWPKRPVCLIDKETGEILERFESCYEAAMSKGAKVCNISHACRLKSSKWRYADEVYKNDVPKVEAPKPKREKVDLSKVSAFKLASRFLGDFTM